jgi:hypothetical protein
MHIIVKPTGSVRMRTDEGTLIAISTALRVAANSYEDSIRMMREVKPELAETLKRQSREALWIYSWINDETGIAG